MQGGTNLKSKKIVLKANFKKLGLDENRRVRSYGITRVRQCQKDKLGQAKAVRMRECLGCNFYVQSGVPWC